MSAGAAAPSRGGLRNASGGFLKYGDGNSYFVLARWDCNEGIIGIYSGRFSWKNCQFAVEKHIFEDFSGKFSRKLEDFFWKTDTLGTKI